MHVLKLITIVNLAIWMYACSSGVSNLLPDRKVEYKKQKVAELDLEVPPDLTKNTIADTMPVPDSTDAATYSAYTIARENKKMSSGSNEVLPTVANVKVIRDGDQRWLEIQASPQKVWNRVLEFWRENGVPLIEQDPGVGIMKTDWLENRADIPQGFITNLLRKVVDNLYSATTRDQFRVRLESGITSEITELYLTHRGMEEKVATSVGGMDENIVWLPRPNDSGLEAEMLRRIMIYLGVAEQTAKTNIVQAYMSTRTRTELEKSNDGSSALLIKSDIDSAWRSVGIALERAGFTIEDRDSTANLYYVKYDDPERETESGFFSWLAFWRNKKDQKNIQYHLQLKVINNTTKLVVLNSQNQIEISETATRILNLVREQIR